MLNNNIKYFHVTCVFQNIFDINDNVKQIIYFQSYKAQFVNISSCVHQATKYLAMSWNTITLLLLDQMLGALWVDKLEVAHVIFDFK